jgi:hypothetical protein
MRVTVHGARHDPLKKEDMTIAGQQFGVIIEERTKARDGTDSPLIHLYSEDDENWFYKQSFDIHWANELLWVMNAAKRRTGR